MIALNSLKNKADSKNHHKLFTHPANFSRARPIFSRTPIRLIVTLTSSPIVWNHENIEYGKKGLLFIEIAVLAGFVRFTSNFACVVF